MDRTRSVLFAFLSLVWVATSLIHHLNIQHDDRHLFKIETFGFVTGGQMDIKVIGFNLHGGKSTHNITSHWRHEPLDSPMRRLEVGHLSSYRTGFVMRHTTSESRAQEDVEFLTERGECLLDHLRVQDMLIDLSSRESWQNTHYSGTVDRETVGMYSLLFAQCAPVSPLFVSFRLEVSFMNPGPDYLSAGDAPLPPLYLSFSLLFLLLTLTWVFMLWRSDARGRSSVHWAMLLLCVFKTLSLLCQSARAHYMSTHGEGGGTGWTILFFLFSALRGIFLFCVLLLVGSGYALIKSALSAQDKNILFLVLLLQVGSNVCMVVLEESAPGSVGYLAWRDALHVLDLLCCLCVLLPIVWSIRHLR